MVDINVMQSVVYFTPVYLFGIWASINRTLIHRLFSGNEVWLLLTAVGLARCRFPWVFRLRSCW